MYEKTLIYADCFLKIKKNFPCLILCSLLFVIVLKLSVAVELLNICVVTLSGVVFVDCNKSNMFLFLFQFYVRIKLYF